SSLSTLKSEELPEGKGESPVAAATRGREPHANIKEILPCRRAGTETLHRRSAWYPFLHSSPAPPNYCPLLCTQKGLTDTFSARIAGGWACERSSTTTWCSRRPAK
ncbi:unnamed protein product, partial [Choristocarpus tenellus]